MVLCCDGFAGLWRTAPGHCKTVSRPSSVVEAVAAGGVAASQNSQQEDMLRHLLAEMQGLRKENAKLQTRIGIVESERTADSYVVASKGPSHRGVFYQVTAPNSRTAANAGALFVGQRWAVATCRFGSTRGPYDVRLVPGGFLSAQPHGGKRCGCFSWLALDQLVSMEGAFLTMQEGGLVVSISPRGHTEFTMEFSSPEMARRWADALKESMAAAETMRSLSPACSHASSRRQSRKCSEMDSDLAASSSGSSKRNSDAKSELVIALKENLHNGLLQEAVCKVGDMRGMASTGGLTIQHDEQVHLADNSPIHFTDAAPPQTEATKDGDMSPAQIVSWCRLKSGSECVTSDNHQGGQEMGSHDEEELGGVCQAVVEALVDHLTTRVSTASCWTIEDSQTSSQSPSSEVVSPSAHSLPFVHFHAMPQLPVSGEFWDHPLTNDQKMLRFAIWLDEENGRLHEELDDSCQAWPDKKIKLQQTLVQGAGDGLLQLPRSREAWDFPLSKKQKRMRLALLYYEEYCSIHLQLMASGHAEDASDMGICRQVGEDMQTLYERSP